MKQGIVGWGNVNKRTYPALKKDESCTWLIIGGGIAGLSAAYFLLKAGEKDIVIVEKHTVGSGSTGRSGGMLVFEPEQASWKHYIQVYGKVKTKLYYDAQQEALELVRNLIVENDIACEYEKEELLVLANTARERALILKDFEARTVLNEQARLIPKQELSKKLKQANYVLGEKIRGEVSVNPLLFARGFADYLKTRGVRIYESTEVTATDKNQASTQNSTVAFKKIINCRGTYERHPKLVKFLTTVCLTQKLTKRELSEIGFLESQMFSDDEGHSFFYGKITKDRRLMVGYGDLKHERPVPYEYVHPPHVRTIERFLKKTFPKSGLEINSAWSAPYAISKGDFPVVEVDSNQALVNGGGTQISSIIASQMAVYALLKKPHPLKKVF